MFSHIANFVKSKFDICAFVIAQIEQIASGMTCGLFRFHFVRYDFQTDKIIKPEVFFFRNVAKNEPPRSIETRDFGDNQEFYLVINQFSIIAICYGQSLSWLGK